MSNYYVVKKNGKYAIIKAGNKRALRLFKTEDEAFKYAEENGLNLHRDDQSPEVISESLPYEVINGQIKNKSCTTDNCKCKKPSLLSRIIGFFKRTN